MAATPYQIELTPAQLDVLRQLSEDTGKTMRDLIFEALEHYADAERTLKANGTGAQSLLDRLNRKGLVGCLQDGPTDLSTNPAHMEGFGRD